MQRVLLDTLTECAVRASGGALPPGRIPPFTRPTGSAAQAADGADLAAPLGFALAARLGAPPAAVAESLATELTQSAAAAGLALSATSSAGFVNVTLDDAAVWGAVLASAAPPAVAASVAAAPEPGAARSPHPSLGARVLIDAGSPNMGKVLHAGHLRSFVQGNALASTLRLAGAAAVDVVSHEGDYGTPLGATLAALLDGDATDWDALQAKGPEAVVAAASAAYARAKARMGGSDPEFDAAVAATTLAMQHGLQGSLPEQSPELEQTLALLRARDVVCASSRAVIDAMVVDTMGIAFDRVPESAYAAGLPALLESVKASAGPALAVVEGGAWGIATPSFDAPLLCVKANGGSLYAATDLAALSQRTAADPGYDALIYVTDAAQSQHFAQLREAGQALGWLDSAADSAHAAGSSSPSFHHHAFGVVRDPDTRSKVSSRAGTADDLTLASLVDRMTAGAAASLDVDLSHPSARALGLAALTYYDIIRPKGYALDLDDILSPSGNTAVYLGYARARIRGLFDKGVGVGSRPDAVAAMVDLSLEPGSAPPMSRRARALATALLTFPQSARAAAADASPAALATALYHVASAFHSWYGSESLLSDPATAPANLVLAAATDAVLATGLDGLGIRHYTV